MANFYRLSVLFIVLVLSWPVWATPNDNEPGKSVPPKVRVGRPVMPNLRALSGLPIKLTGASPLPWSRSVNPAMADPIRLLMRVSKDSVALGEEFEITITAQLLDISPQTMFFFEEQKAFTLKVLMPEGFQQTGGDYYDYIGADFRQGGATSITYRLRGLLSEPSSKATFTLLRGPKDGSAISLFEKKQELNVRTIHSTDTLIHTHAAQARQATTTSTGCQLPNQTASIRQGATVTGMTSLSILIQNAASTYLYSPDSIYFTASNVVKVFQSSGYVYVRDSQQKNCYRKFPYTVKQQPKAGGTSAQGSTTNFVPDDGNCPVAPIGIAASSLTVCSGDDPPVSVASARVAATSTTSSTITLTGCSAQVQWHKGESIYGSNTNANANGEHKIEVTTDGLYWGVCQCPNGDVVSAEIRIMRCPPYLFSPKTTVCNSETTTIQVSGCPAGSGIAFKNLDGYTVCRTVPASGIYIFGGLVAGTYFAQCITNANDCDHRTPTSDWSEPLTLSCPPVSCDFAISGTTSNTVISVSCNNTVTLTANCVGNCNNVIAGWSGPGWSQVQSGFSVTSPQQTSNGDADYTFTLSKAGCVNKTVTVTLRTSDCITCEGQPAPSQPTSVTGDTQCSGGIFHLAASGCPTGTSYRWHQSDTGGSLLSDLSTYSPYLTTTTVFYVSCANSCKESSRVSVTAVVGDCSTSCSGVKDYASAWDLPASCTSVHGWALDKNCPQSLTLGVYIDNALHTTIPASGYRDDVWRVLTLTNSFTSCGFSWTPDFTGTHTVSVKLPNGVEIGSVQLTCGNSNTCTGQPTTPDWQPTSETTCNGGVRYQLYRDMNSCSTSYLSTTALQAVDNSVCQLCSGIPTPTISSVTNSADNTITWTLTAVGCGTGKSVRWFRVGQGSYDPDRNPIVFTSPDNDLVVYAKCVSGDCPGPQSNTLAYTPTSPCTNGAPTSPSVQSQTSCSGNSLTLMALGCDVNGYRWYTTSSGGISFNTTGSYSTILGSTTSYYVSCSTACGESGRVQVTGTVTSVPTPTITLDQNVLTASGCTQTARWYRADDGNFYDPDRLTFDISGVQNGFQFFVKCIQDGCIGQSSATYTVSNCATPSAPQLSARLAGTSTAQSLTLTASGCPAGSTVQWYGPNNTTATGSIWVITSFTQTAEFSAKCVVSPTCEGTSAPITVTRKNPQAPTIQTTATYLCTGQSVTLTAGCPAGTPLWSTGQTGSPLVLTPTATASYYAYCLDGEVRSANSSNTTQITLANSLTVNGRTDYVVGETISLTAISSVQGSTYTWSGPAGFTRTGQVLQIIGSGVSQAGSYTVVANAPNQGCAGRQAVTITVADISFNCTCQDCDNPAINKTDNPDVGASNKGSLSQNFVQESVYLKGDGSTVVQTITYLDGLGRPLQKVNVGTGGKTAAVAVADVVQPIVYDAFGRESVRYLPYAAASNNGAYRPSAAGSVSGYYGGLPDKTGNAFSTITYERSPLNRVLFQTAPGSNAPVRLNYRTNTTGELPLLTYNFSAHTISVASYDAAALYVTETTDENGAKTTEYKDKEGHVVGKDVSGLKTLYCYDDFGWLRCVVPPKAVGSMGSSFDPFTVNDLLFAYDYDERGRMTRKKVPGAGVTVMTYDTRDRLITSTDAKNTTTTTAYDNLDRPTSTRQGNTFLTFTKYDTYGSEARPFDPGQSYGVSSRSSMRGQVTSTASLVMGTEGRYVSRTVYYDDLGRVIQTVGFNQKDALDYSSDSLDYVGRTRKSRLSTTNSSTTIVVDTRTAYDAGSRVKSICQRVSDNLQTLISNPTLAYWEPVARHSYNGIGELTRKTLGCGIQNIDYTYQMRGWLSKMNDPAELNVGFKVEDKRFFGMKLTYDAVGNISQWTYRNAQYDYVSSSHLTQQAAYTYGFSYDNLNRIKTGTLSQQGNTVFSLGGNDNGIRYDENGNIKHLTRTMGSATDVLTYTYGATSNQLQSVNDDGNAGFATSSSYSYDPNGNLLSDIGKGISNISYNHLNLPVSITKTGGNVGYLYSASGQKLRADLGNGKAYDYVGGLVYDKDGLEFIPTAEGRVLPPGRASTSVVLGSTNTVTASNQFYRYEYQLKDHLGNLRVSCRCGEKASASSPSDTYAPLVVQEQHYDPFGLDLPGLGLQPDKVASRFKFNGKEDEVGLGWIDFNWRHYDPSIARFFNVDKLAEKFPYLSTYQFASNDPVGKLELDGLEGVNFNDPYSHISQEERYKIYSEDAGKPMEGSKFGVSSNASLGFQVGEMLKIAGVGVGAYANAGSIEVASGQLDLLDGNKAQAYTAPSIIFKQGLEFQAGIGGAEASKEITIKGMREIESKKTHAVSIGPLKIAYENTENFTYDKLKKTYTKGSESSNLLLTIAETKAYAALGFKGEIKGEFTLGGLGRQTIRFIDRLPNQVRQDATRVSPIVKPKIQKTFWPF